MIYKVIDKSQAEEIAKLAICLTHEIIERTAIKHFDVDVPLAVSLCENYVANNLYNVIAAFDENNENKIVGFGTLCESRSLYAQGTFGIVQEFYVLPSYRSRNIGKRLIKEIVNFAKDKQLKRLELCTPPLPEFDQTVAFYQDNGFQITGGHKMKLCIV